MNASTIYCCVRFYLTPVHTCMSGKTKEGASGDKIERRFYIIYIRFKSTSTMIQLFNIHEVQFFSKV